MPASIWLPVFVLLILTSFSSTVHSTQFTCEDGSSRVDIDGSTPGEIISPNFPKSYPANKDCSWKIKAPLGSLVRVTLSDLNLGKGDSLTLSDGETAFPGNTIGRYTKCMDGKLSLFSTGSNMVIQFKSDAVDDKVKGFKLTFKVVKKSEIETSGKVERTCSDETRITESTEYIAHSEFPNSISSRNPKCTYLLNGPSSKDLYLSYKMFGLGKKINDFCDYSTIRHNLQGSSSRAGTYFCGCKRPENLVLSSGGTGYMQFFDYVSDQTYTGFLAYFKALDPGACSDLDNCDQLKDDRDVGFDRNGNVLFERKPVTTKAPATTIAPIPEKVPQKQFQIECKRDEIEIVLNITKYHEFHHESATLVDTTCKAYHTNSTHVFIKTALDECGTTHNYSSDGRYINYHNQILIQKKSKEKSGVITRDHEAAFMFECKYYRSVVLSVVHFTPARAKVYTSTDGFGNFTYEMKMYKSKNYQEAHDDYPVNVLASQRVFFQVEVLAKDAELVLFVENCKVTPSKDRNDKESYVIIEEGCERDETLKYKHKLSAVQRFNFKAFYFESDRDATIHIHCKVLVCRKTDKNSRCHQGCPYSKRRRRNNDVEGDHISGDLMIGPLQNENNGQTASSPESRTIIVEILIGVLGLVVIMLFAAIIVVIMKRRGQQPKGLKLILEEE